jgi:hypothetical protein
MSDSESTISQAADAVEEASNHPALDVLARAGFAVMALLHVIIGAIAIAVAFGQPGEAEPTGAIEQLAANAWGPAVMWACVAACTGLALWQASESDAAGPPPAPHGAGFQADLLGLSRHRLRQCRPQLRRLRVGLRGDSSESTQDFSASVMATPWGPWALVALGLTIIGIGIYFVFKGVRRGFKEELFHFDGTRRGQLIDGLGISGHIAKGVALGLTGLLFVIAAAKHDPNESTGLDGSLKALRDHPFGPYLLVAIGAGFIAYGIFALIRSRFGRM